MKSRNGHKWHGALRRKIVKGTIVAGLLTVALPAMAVLDGRDIIGPHEYDLPVHFKPFNVFVQYGDFDNGSSVWDKTGNKVGGAHTQTIVGLSKYVRFWVPDWAPDIGLAYEIIVPEVSVRSTSLHTSAAGISDPLTGPAVWFNPINTENFKITLGQDFLIQVPVGDSAVGGGDAWHLNSAFLYNIDYYKWNLVGDVGILAPLSNSAATATRPGLHFYLDADLAYQVLPWLAPFVAATYETNGSTNDLSGAVVAPRGRETLIGGGVYIPTFPNQSITLRYSKGISGTNHAATNEIGIKYVYVW